mmetsp:Transcript_49080/g.59452  ORF Transcript_49080/g.59452 Transcript_49080/m.59452 type:complete len:222 (-) Transcript_49080:5-670(-)
MKDDISLGTTETADLTITSNSSTKVASKLYCSDYSTDSYKRVEVLQRSSGREARKSLELITCHPYNLQVQVSSCEFIARISHDEFYRVVIASSGGILIILNSMHLYPDNSRIQASGCVILGNMCTSSYANRAQVCAANGVEVIINAMQAHNHNPRIQSSGFFALQQLMSTEAHTSSPNDSKGVLAKKNFEATISDKEPTSSDKSMDDINVRLQYDSVIGDT